MVYRKLHVGVIIRVILILCCSLAIGVTGFSADYLHTLIVLFIVLTALAANLVWYVNITNRHLAEFFNNLTDSAEGLNISAKNRDKSFRELLTGIDRTRNIIRDARREREKDHLFLKYLVGSIGNGIIAFTDNGEVLLANEAAGRMFSLPHIGNISQMKSVNRDIEDILMNASPSEKIYLKCIVNNAITEVVAFTSSFRINEKEVRLVSFQNINEMLSRQEIVAWQKIIRVLAHEIMSSISPITSLSDHLYLELSSHIRDQKQPDECQELSEDLLRGLQIITGRSKRMMGFVEKYRTMSNPIEPKFRKTELKEVIETVTTLARREFPGLEISLSLPECRPLYIDQGLIEQCLINIIRNSYQAMDISDLKPLIISATDTPHQTEVTITDSGSGIDPEILDQIFIPFFTTRKEGSGIGLSLSRHVMILHGGEIGVKQGNNGGTIVSLIFKRRIEAPASPEEPTGH